MNQNNTILFCTTPFYDVNVEGHFENENFGITQKSMRELFGVEMQTDSQSTIIENFVLNRTENMSRTLTR